MRKHHLPPASSANISLLWSGVSPELSLCLYKHIYCVTVEKKWNHIYISFCKPHLSLTGGGASVNITAQVYGILFNRCLIFHCWDSV